MDLVKGFLEVREAMVASITSLKSLETAAKTCRESLEAMGLNLSGDAPAKSKKKKMMSAESREKIAVAQRKRWAEAKKKDAAPTTAATPADNPAASPQRKRSAKAKKEDTTFPPQTTQTSEVGVGA